MKTFLAIYTCAENSNNHEAWKKLDSKIQEERMQKGMLKLEQWNEKFRDQIVFQGGHLGSTTKRVDLKGIHDTPRLIGAFMVIQANSHEEAAGMFLDHPHFSIFPGDAVEIIERLENPKN